MDDKGCGQITPELLELGRMGIIKWDGNSGFSYQEENKWLVNLALHEPVSCCPTCKSKQRPKEDWNAIMKRVRNEIRGREKQERRNKFEQYQTQKS